MESYAASASAGEGVLADRSAMKWRLEYLQYSQRGGDAQEVKLASSSRNSADNRFRQTAVAGVRRAFGYRNDVT
jgi:hypothetical protein